MNKLFVLLMSTSAVLAQWEIDGIKMRILKMRPGEFSSESSELERGSLRSKNLVSQREGMLLPFLENASDKSKIAVRKVLMDKKSSRTEKDRRIEEILRNESLVVQEAFMQFKADIAAEQERREAVHKEIVSRMSKEAQVADQQLRALFKNESLSHKERRTKIEDIFDILPESVKDELRSLENREERQDRGRSRNMFINLQDPMTRLKWGQEVGQLEARPIRVSSDGDYVEI